MKHKESLLHGIVQTLLRKTLIYIMYLYCDNHVLENFSLVMLSMSGDNTFTFCFCIKLSKSFISKYDSLGYFFPLQFSMFYFSL